MKLFNFADFQKAWDAQERVFEQMQLIKKDELQKMITASTKVKKYSPAPKKKLWKIAIAACIVGVALVTTITLMKYRSNYDNKIMIAKQIDNTETTIAQTTLQHPIAPLQNISNEDSQTELRSLSTTESNEPNRAEMLINATRTSLSSTGASRRKSEVTTQYSYREIEPSVSGVANNATPEANRTIVNENYGHKAYIMSNYNFESMNPIDKLQQLL